MTKKVTKKYYATSPDFSFYPQSKFMTGSWHMLERAQEKEEGSFYDFLASMLFSAFCIEAYLNFAGQEKLTTWRTIERKLSPEDKLKLLCELADFSPDMSIRPFQTFNEMFRFRNDVVHAKPETVSRPGETIELKCGGIFKR